MTATPTSILLGFAHLVQLWKVIWREAVILIAKGSAVGKGQAFPSVLFEGMELRSFSPCCLTFKIKIFLSPHLSLSNLCDCNLRHRLKRTSVNKSLLFSWIFFPVGLSVFLHVLKSDGWLYRILPTNRNEDRLKEVRWSKTQLVAHTHVCYPSWECCAPSLRTPLACCVSPAQREQLWCGRQHCLLSWLFFALGTPRYPSLCLESLSICHGTDTTWEYTWCCWKGQGPQGGSCKRPVNAFNLLHFARIIPERNGQKSSSQWLPDTSLENSVLTFALN